MPPETKIKKMIPTLYKRDALSHLLMGWVTGVRHNLIGSTIENTVEQFKSYYGLSEEDYPTDSAIRAYHTMMKELHELLKSPSE